MYGVIWATLSLYGAVSMGGHVSYSSEDSPPFEGLSEDSPLVRRCPLWKGCLDEVQLQDEDPYKGKAEVY